MFIADYNRRICMYRSYPQSGTQPSAIIGIGPSRIGPDKAEKLIRLLITMV